MEFEENNEEFEGKRTKNLKGKHREFFTRENYLCTLIVYLNFVEILRLGYRSLKSIARLSL
jgi:hypothetical protein